MTPGRLYIINNRYFISLKPLSAIMDEDAIEVAKIMERVRDIDYMIKEGRYFVADFEKHTTN